MATHTLKELENGYWRLTLIDNGDWADFESKQGAIGYLLNINKVFHTEFTIQEDDT